MCRKSRTVLPTAFPAVLPRECPLRPFFASPFADAAVKPCSSLTLSRSPSEPGVSCTCCSARLTFSFAAAAVGSKPYSGRMSLTATHTSDCPGEVLEAAASFAWNEVFSLAATTSRRNCFDRGGEKSGPCQAVPAQFRERIEPSCCLSENGVYPPEKCCNIRTVALRGNPTTSMILLRISAIVEVFPTRRWSLPSVCMCLTVTTTWSAAATAAGFAELLTGATFVTPARHTKCREPAAVRPSPFTWTRKSP
mmetsp:Transcript_106437/g.254112  ORF Transcript_106437/g.254112 Transcript_106437/m.254112 type:complete len:251 (-) Transcript_106437:1058-1810(-)